MFCIHCGAEAAGEFCSSCGQRIVKGDSGKSKKSSGRVKRMLISVGVIAVIYSYVAFKIGSVMP